MTVSKESGFPALNASIGFLSLLLGVLLFALTTRIIYPRIINKRADSNTILISQIIQLEVLNGCGIPGLANQFTTKLRKLGFDVIETGNFENFNVSETFIISRTGNMENARRIATALGLEENRIIREKSNDFYLDATLVIGSDFNNLNLD